MKKSIAAIALPLFLGRIFFGGSWGFAADGARDAGDTLSRLDRLSVQIETLAQEEAQLVRDQDQVIEEIGKIKILVNKHR